MGRQNWRLSMQIGRELCLRIQEYINREGGDRELDLGKPAGEGVWELADSGFKDEGEVLSSEFE